MEDLDYEKTITRIFGRPPGNRINRVGAAALEPLLPNTVNLYTPALTGFQHQRPEERETTALVIALKARFRTGHRLDRKTPERRCFTD